jgi:hypothetical protein
MAADYNARSDHARQAIADTAKELGLWSLVHTVTDKGGEHVHIQGLAPGDVPEAWLSIYGDD